MYGIAWRKVSDVEHELVYHEVMVGSVKKINGRWRSHCRPHYFKYFDTLQEAQQEGERYLRTVQGDTVKSLAIQMVEAAIVFGLLSMVIHIMLSR